MFVVTITHLSPFLRTRRVEQRGFRGATQAVNWFCERMEHRDVTHGRGELSMLGAVPLSDDQLRERGWTSHNGTSYDHTSVIGTIRWLEAE